MAKIKAMGASISMSAMKPSYTRKRSGVMIDLGRPMKIVQPAKKKVMVMKMKMNKKGGC